MSDIGNDIQQFLSSTSAATMSLGPDPAVAAAIERGNKVVFFDVVLGDSKSVSTGELGRIKLELFVNEVRLVVCHVRSSLCLIMFSQHYVLTACMLLSVPRHVKTFDNFAPENTFGITTLLAIRIPYSIV